MRSELGVSVVICAYTEERLAWLVEAVESVTRQTRPARETIVVIDHNPGLFKLMSERFPEHTVVENSYERGLSGGRNTGLALAKGEVVAFMDDDAEAAPDWLANLSDAYVAPSVLAVGGAIIPVWQGGRPRWFPDEFNWVVGCTFRGLPETTAPVRNLIGCNMSFRRSVFDTVGGFQIDMGRIGTLPVGCEETELCIRTTNRWKDALILYEPNARMYHKVRAERGTWRYYRERCFAEGVSKAQLSHIVGAGSALSHERRYVRRTLPLGVARGLGDALLRLDPSGFARAGAIAAGVAFTGAGYFKARRMSSPSALAAQRDKARPGAA